MSSSLTFPSRYEPLRRLGTGGGGEVWAVLDRVTREELALKVLAEGASEHEMTALVREAIALSGLEGLGVPRVMRFGRLPGSGRPYMVRELVLGTSLEALMGTDAPSERVLRALVRAAEQLTLVHRAGFFHGDVKPANIIVGLDGEATLVDLGLAAPWRDAGTTAQGLTPRYAAPELLSGGPLTVRAEVYALGVALRESVERGGSSLNSDRMRSLLTVAQRATAVSADARYPSADEFASALRRAAGLERRDRPVDPTLIWPIVGIEAIASRLITAVIRLGQGQVLLVSGDAGSGRSVLLRRLAWSLGVEDKPLIWVDEYLACHVEAVRTELRAHPSLEDLTLLVDDADSVDADVRDAIANARASGAAVVSVGEQTFGGAAERFQLPRLAEHTALEILKRAVPSLTPSTASQLIEAAHGLPGQLKCFVGRLASSPVVSDDDVQRLLSGLDDEATAEELGVDPLARALDLLARGRFKLAERALERVTEGDRLVIAVAKARLAVGMGDGTTAMAALEAVREEAEERRGSPEAKAWQMYMGRSHLALAEYSKALELLAELRDEPTATGAEALCFEGLALSHIDDSDGARAALERAVEVSRNLGAKRVEALAQTCLGLVLQRGDLIDQAQVAYHEALSCAQAAGDANMMGTAQLNLAVLLKVRGDVARAIEHFEAAVDMGERSGRRATVRFALLNLANMDLYLGRLARARINIETLEQQHEQMPANARAQLYGLQAELFGRTGDIEQSVASYEKCALAYEELGHGLDSAEARLEGLLVRALGREPDLAKMTEDLARARAQLAGATAHAALLGLAAARVHLSAGDEDCARKLLDQGLESARVPLQRDYVWRILATRAALEDSGGQYLMARRDRTEAVTVLEEIAARLPRDLREVFWNDPRRRELRALVEVSMATASTQIAYAPVPPETSKISSSISAFTTTPLEQRLVHLLEINRELLGELDLNTLTEKVIGHAVDLLQAERGFVILRNSDGTLEVRSSSTRSGDTEHHQFSRSIAEQVMETREAVVSLSAQDDTRMDGFSSVHQMALQSVACVPISARLGEPIGALYVETRRKVGRAFQREVPTLRAFADQVALAFETARLVTENRRRADQLAEANSELRRAQVELEELLGERTARLKKTREKLRAARTTLDGHFGYQGIVGTCEAMRRVYSLIDRVKDTNISLLITGESGTGKEVAARAIHRSSVRSKGPFLGINCGAIPEHLLESELFGSVRGAFTGADRDRKGLLREAAGGTVLLDEIGEMPQKMQAGLLRVLQEQKVRPVGGTQEVPVDCRFVFATHRNLKQLVAENKFREDLYYRIHVVELSLPALRDRVDDIPMLVDHFLGIFAARYKRERKSLTRPALRKLASYSWPGNVRQMEHVLLNAWVLGDEGDIDAEDLDLPGEVPGYKARESLSELEDDSDPLLDDEESDEAEVEGPRSSQPGPQISGSTTEAPRAKPTAAAVGTKKGSASQHRRTEKDRIIEALEASNWNRVKAAEISGIPRRTFYRRLREYKIQ